jgi:hypothetical protein
VRNLIPNEFEKSTFKFNPMAAEREGEFSQMLNSKLSSRALIHVNLDVEVIQSLFQDICTKLDKMDGAIRNLEAKCDSKVDNDRFGCTVDDLDKRLYEMEKNVKVVMDAQGSAVQTVLDLLKDNDEKIEDAVAKCVVDARSTTRNMISQMEPELFQNIMNQFPNLDSLTKDNEAKQAQIDDLKREIAALKSGAESNVAVVRELPSDLSVVNIGLSECDSKLEALRNDIDSKLGELRQHSDQNDDKLRDELALLKVHVDEKLVEVFVETAKIVSTGSTQESVLIKMEQAEKRVSTTISEIQREISDLRDAMNDLKVGSDENLSKIVGLQRELHLMKTEIENKPITESIVVKESGEIDLSPILLELRQQHSKIEGHNDRIKFLEEKETVHPMVLGNVRDKVTDLDNKLRDLRSKFDKMADDLKIIEGASTHHGERIDVLESQISRVSTENRLTFGAHDRSLYKLEESLRELSGKIANLLTSKPVKVREVENTTSDRFDVIDKEFASERATIASILSAIEGISSRVKLISDPVDVSGDLIEIRSELKQLWSKIRDLTSLQAESHHDLLPKINLDSGHEKPRTAVEKTTLPRIATIKVPHVDPKFAEELTKIDKQGEVILQLKRTVESHQRDLQILDENKADRGSAQRLFEQFRIAMGELNNRIGSLKRALVGKVDAADLNNYLGEMMAFGGTDETATATGPVRCLCCGKPRKMVTGALDDPALAQRLGAPVSTRVLGDGEGQVCFVYGENGDMFVGRSVTGRSIYSKAPDVQESSRTSK